MKTYLVVGCLSIFIFSANAQKYLKPFLNLDTKLWGYKGYKTDTSLVPVILKAKYKTSNSFVDGVTEVVDEADEVYFINEKGEKIEPTKAQGQSYWRWQIEMVFNDNFAKGVSKGWRNIDTKIDITGDVQKGGSKKLTIKKDPENPNHPFVSSTKSGLSFIQPYEILSRAEYTQGRYTKYFRINQPFRFGKDGEGEYGFGFFLNLWYGTYSCKQIQHIGFIIMNTGRVMMFDKKYPQEDQYVSSAYNTWTAKKKFEFHDFANYKEVGKFEFESSGANEFSMIRYNEQLQLFINNQKFLIVPLIDCEINYDEGLVPIFYNKGPIKLYEGTDKTLYDKN